MDSREVINLPVPDSGCGNITLCANGGSVLAQYEYRDHGCDYIGGLQFDGAVSFRFSNEMHSQGFCPGSYDCVVEVLDSDWLRETIAKEPSGISFSARRMHHFAVLFSSNGYLEVISDNVRETERRTGRLPDDD